MPTKKGLVDDSKAMETIKYLLSARLTINLNSKLNLTKIKLKIQKEKGEKLILMSYNEVDHAIRFHTI